MSQPNPFAAPQQVASEQQPNPFGPPAAAPAAPQAYAPQQPNPFGAGVPAAAPVPPHVPQPPAAPSPFGGAPQAYAPQQAPAAAPQYAPPAAAPVQAYAPPAAPMTLDPNALRAAGAPPASYSKGPELPDMYGRLVLIFPQDIARVPRNPRFITDQDRARGNVEQDRMTATIVVLDSGPGTPPGTGTIAWGGAPYALPPTPHTNNDPLPYVVKGKWISQSKLIDQCRAYVPAPGGAPGMVAGRLVKRGPQHNDPWYLETATEAELAIASQYLQLVNEQRYPHPLAPA